MTDQTYLTPEEVTERYRGTISVGTLRNWRSMRIGPAFVKVGKSVLWRGKRRPASATYTFLCKDSVATFRSSSRTCRMRSIKPHSSASSAVMKRSRSMARSNSS